MAVLVYYSCGNHLNGSPTHQYRSLKQSAPRKITFYETETDSVKVPSVFHTFFSQKHKKCEKNKVCGDTDCKYFEPIYSLLSK